MGGKRVRPCIMLAILISSGRKMAHSRPRAALFEKIALGLIQPLAASEHVPMLSSRKAYLGRLRMVFFRRFRYCEHVSRLAPQHVFSCFRKRSLTRPPSKWHNPRQTDLGYASGSRGQQSGLRASQPSPSQTFTRSGHCPPGLCTSAYQATP